MPELPEVEITARRLDGALRGARIESAQAPGINALKTFDPPLTALTERQITGVRRRGKHLIVDIEGELALLLHLMSDEALTKLGPEAWPDPPDLADVKLGKRPLHTALRDQHVIAGIGRSWADEILWHARLSPFKRGDDLDDAQRATLREAIVKTLGDALDHYERTIELPIPDKLPMPLLVHRHEGQPCPRCGTTLLAVHFEDYVIAYCPTDQTDGRALKDRRLSRLLK
jgi:formamidopyrimidine-DNA glycosylase